MDKKFPKHLVLTLNGLLEDNRLTSWTVQANCDMTSVTIRFKMADCMEEGLGNSLSKFRRVPPSQVQRDQARVSQWKDRPQQSDELFSEDSGDRSPSDGTIPKSTISSLPPKSANQTQQSKQATSVTTRSKARLDSANPSPSPIPQTDGTNDHASDNTDIDTTNIGTYELNFMRNYRANPERLRRVIKAAGCSLEECQGYG